MNSYSRIIINYFKLFITVINILIISFVKIRKFIFN